MAWNLLKSPVELSETANCGDNSLQVCQYIFTVLSHCHLILLTVSLPMSHWDALRATKVPQNRRHNVANQSTSPGDLFHTDWFKTTSLMSYWPTSRSLQMHRRAVGKSGKIVTRERDTSVLLALIIFSPHLQTLLFIIKCHSFQFIAVLF